ncbi:MAG: hypothetical protein M3495_19245 [Pseudomonadota bacterium]|nr:hypothetical protein [Pseudomonadota bacterium]
MRSEIATSASDAGTAADLGEQLHLGDSLAKRRLAAAVGTGDEGEPRGLEIDVVRDVIVVPESQDRVTRAAERQEVSLRVHHPGEDRRGAEGPRIAVQGQQLVDPPEGREHSPHLVRRPKAIAQGIDELVTVESTHGRDIQEGHRQQQHKRDPGER